MTTKTAPKLARVTKAFDFSKIEAGKRPAASDSQDVKSAYFTALAAARLDTLLDTVEANMDNAANVKSAVVTFIGQCIGRDYFNLTKAAQSHPLMSQAVIAERHEKRIETVTKAVASMTAAERAELIAALTGAK